jgi:hypothetical protein
MEYLRMAIRELRRKIELDPAHPLHIVTEIGVGYRLEVGTTIEDSLAAGSGRGARMIAQPRNEPR